MKEKLNGTAVAVAVEMERPATMQDYNDALFAGDREKAIDLFYSVAMLQMPAKKVLHEGLKCGARDMGEQYMITRTDL